MPSVPSVMANLSYISIAFCVPCFIVFNGTIGNRLARQTAGNGDPVIETENGRISGGQGQTVGLGKKYYFFRGIPYAEPPVGNLRFMPPVPKANWNGVLNALEEGSECVQGFKPVTGSEDCLFINVYVPQIPPAHDSLALPVMTYIHGGSFNSQNSSYVRFGPDYLLDHDVIVVTLNYRLGIFGFFSTGDLTAPGNYGLKDQNMALRWVQKNIAKFGGDPTKVTIFGESAGSVSVSYHLQSPLSKGLFTAAIMQSGTSLCLWGLSRFARLAAFLVGDLIRLPAAGSEALVNNLRRVDYKALQMIAWPENLAQFILVNPRDGIISAPVIEPVHDGAFFTNKSHQLLLEGQFNRVPTIVGFNSMEGSTDITLPIRIYLTKFQLDPGQLTPADMNVDLITKILLGYDIKYHYFGLKPVNFATAELIQFVSDDQFNRPIREFVRLLSLHAPVYYYQFTYEGLLGGVTKREVPGAIHAEELNYLWRSFNNGNATQNDELIRERMVTLWTNFAKYRYPTPPTNPRNVLNNVTWPTAGQARDGHLFYMDIGSNLVVKDNPLQPNMDYWNSLYRQFGRPPYDTY